MLIVFHKYREATGKPLQGGRASSVQRGYISALGPLHLKVWGEERKLIKNSSIPPPLSSHSSELGGGGRGVKQFRIRPPPPARVIKILSSHPNTVSRSGVSVKKCRHGTSGRYRESAKIGRFRYPVYGSGYG